VIAGGLNETPTTAQAGTRALTQRLPLTQREGLASGAGVIGMDERRWRVGELADATGLTVRTLHHFDEIGLLCPTERSTAGHRLYTDMDVRTLHRIVTLRRLGMSLAHIATALNGSGMDLAALLSRQIAEVDRTVVAQHQLRSRLVAVRHALSEGARPDIDQLLDAMEAIVNDPGFTAEQKATFAKRHGPRGEALAQWQLRGAELDAEARRLASAGIDPADDAAQDLGWRWAGLFEDMAGGDRAVLSSLYARLDRKGPEQATRGVISAETWDFVRRVLAVGFGHPAADR
jgi:MerR family transcriptional regulator, thiopeptide resistance regulator